MISFSSSSSAESLSKIRVARNCLNHYTIIDLSRFPSRHKVPQVRIRIIKSNSTTLRNSKFGLISPVIHEASSPSHCKTHSMLDVDLLSSLFGSCKFVAVFLSTEEGALPRLRSRSSLSLCLLVSCFISLRFWKISLKAWFMAFS